MMGEAIPLVEHYVCCGAGSTIEPAAAAGPNTKWHQLPYKPVVLSQFSAHAASASPPYSAVAAFCLPSALRLTRHARPSWWPPHFSCFVLTLGDGSRLFGHCLTTHVRLPGETLVQQLTAAMTEEGAQKRPKTQYSMYGWRQRRQRAAVADGP